MFSQRGKGEAKQQGLEIPVNLKYTLGLGSMFGIYLAAGPDFFFNFKDFDGIGVNTEKSQVAINVGAGLKLLRKLQVGLTYQIPMSDSYTVDMLGRSASKAGVKTKTWQVSLAYIF
jgi:hypothetical protein